MKIIKSLMAGVAAVGVFAGVQPAEAAEPEIHIPSARETAESNFVLAKDMLKVYSGLVDTDYYLVSQWKQIDPARMRPICHNYQGGKVEEALEQYSKDAVDTALDLIRVLKDEDVPFGDLEENGLRQGVYVMLKTIQTKNTIKAVQALCSESSGGGVGGKQLPAPTPTSI